MPPGRRPPLERALAERLLELHDDVAHGEARRAALEAELADLLLDVDRQLVRAYALGREDERAALPVPDADELLARLRGAAP